MKKNISVEKHNFVSSLLNLFLVTSFMYMNSPIFSNLNFLDNSQESPD